MNATGRPAFPPTAPHILSSLNLNYYSGSGSTRRAELTGYRGSIDYVEVAVDERGKRAYDPPRGPAHVKREDHLFTCIIHIAFTDGADSNGQRSDSLRHRPQSVAHITGTREVARQVLTAGEVLIVDSHVERLRCSGCFAFFQRVEMNQAGHRHMAARATAIISVNRAAKPGDKAVARGLIASAAGGLKLSQNGHVAHDIPKMVFQRRPRALEVGMRTNGVGSEAQGSAHVGKRD